MQDCSAPWSQFTSPRFCRKIQSSAAKSWNLQKSPCVGNYHVCKALAQAGSLMRYKQAIKLLVLRRLEVRDFGVVSTLALEYRRMVLETFIPATKSAPRRHGVIQASASFFNSDWRQQALVHICKPGCCPSAGAAREKGAFLIKKLMASLRPSMFSRANMTSWQESLPFFAFSWKLAFGHDRLQHVAEEGSLLEALDALTARPTAARLGITVDVPDQQLLEMPLAEAMSVAAVQR